jgi:predicted transcriptional regulator
VIKINILKGRLTKNEISRFVGVEEKDIEKSLDHLSNLGFLKYEKIRGGKYQFILYPEPVREMELNSHN